MLLRCIPKLLEKSSEVRKVTDRTTGRPLAIVVLATMLMALGCATKYDDDLTPPPLRSKFTMDGRLVLALNVAVKRMQEYPLLSSEGRDVSAYNVWTVHDSVNGLATFTFAARFDEKTRLDTRSVGAFETRVIVRLVDLKVMSFNVYN
jgi:hypothetical protein